MVTAVASTPTRRSTRRPLLLPSDPGNAPPSRPKIREITSRYLNLSTSSSSSYGSSSSMSTIASYGNSGSSISSRRCPSPILGGRTAITTPKSLQRAVSAERRRTPLSRTEKVLVTSARSLSASFQGEAYVLPSSKVKPPTTSLTATPGGLRKGTPERRKLGVTTPASERREKNRVSSRSTDQLQHQQHRWPGRSRADNSSLLTCSLDYSSDKGKLSGSGSVIKNVRKSMADETVIHKAVTELKFKKDAKEIGGIIEVESGWRLRDSLNFDMGNSNAVQIGKQLYRIPNLSPPLSNHTSNRTLGPSKLTLPKKFPNDNAVSSPQELYPSGVLSPVRAGTRTASPCRALSSMSGAGLRGIASPSRIRSKTGSSMNDDNMCSTPSLLSFATDVKRGKLGENRIVDAHDLRLLYNRLLQWRLANAKVETTMLMQRQTTERSLYDAWITISKLQHSIVSKEVELQFLRHKQKLYSILKKQYSHLETWSLLDRDYHSSVSDAIRALEGSTIRLPLVRGARADVLKVKEAVTSAVGVMQAMASSVGALLVEVEQMDSLVSELSKLSAWERCLLDEYRDLFSRTYIPLQVMECSRRSQILQAEKASFKKEVR